MCLSKLDTLLHKTHIKVLLVLRYKGSTCMCRSILSLSKKHIKCGVITHSAKETGQQKEQWGWGLEVTRNLGLGSWTKLEKMGGGGVGNTEMFS